MKRQGNCWPDKNQALLLKAIFSSDLEAQESWAAYLKKVDLQNVDDASFHLLPLVYRKLEGKVSGSAFETCKSVYRHTWSRNVLLLRMLKQVLSSLASAGVQVCFLKGVALVDCCCPDVGMRVFGDADLLVERYQAKDAIQVLLKSGFALEEYSEEDVLKEDFLASHHAVFLKNESGQKIDLHWHLSSDAVTDQSLANFEYQKKPAHRFQAFVFRPEDQLIHVLMHGIRYSSVPLIRWVSDAVLILRHHPEFDWNYFQSQMRQLHLEGLAQMALLYLKETGFVELPEAVLKKYLSYRPSFFEKAHIRFLTQKPFCLTESIKIVWYQHVRNTRPRHYAEALYRFPGFLKKRWQADSFIKMMWIG
ncbi:MAG: hypothetical protein EBX40_04915, partial [Gammaproteobacteria bacterium]|nr:hypothetical protein [Gammaproteobacteria bacterium]